MQLVNLNPNLILALTMYVHLCEAYLTMEPDIDIFTYFFILAVWGQQQDRSGEISVLLASPEG